MIEYVTSTVLCLFLQVSAIALAGQWLVGAVMRRRPRTARSLAYATTLLIVFVTIVSPVPMPDLLQGVSLEDGETLSKTEVSTSRIVRAAGDFDGSENIRSAARDQMQFGISWAEVAARLRGTMTTASAHRDSGAEQTQDLFAGIAGLLLLGTVFGLACFARAVGETRLIARQAKPLDDARVRKLVAELCESLQLKVEPRLVESHRVSSASVIGWRRPRIALPANWHGWNESELRAVLTHEMAHVLAGDFVWRSISCFVASVHALNPMARLHFNQLALCQEMIADSVAARAQGRAVYLSNLSRLMLSEHQPRKPLTTGMVPVFSGCLIRRIKMMRKMDFEHCNRGSFGYQSAGIGLLALVCLLTCAAPRPAQVNKHTNASSPMPAL